MSLVLCDHVMTRKFAKCRSVVVRFPCICEISYFNHYNIGTSRMGIHHTTGIKELFYYQISCMAVTGHKRMYWKCRWWFWRQNSKKVNPPNKYIEWYSEIKEKGTISSLGLGHALRIGHLLMGWWGLKDLEGSDITWNMDWPVSFGKWASIANSVYGILYYN